MHQDQVRYRITPVQNARNLERHFAISVAEDGPGALLSEDQIHPGAPSDFREGNTHISAFEQKFLANPVDDLLHAVTSFQVRKDDWL